MKPCELWLAPWAIVTELGLTLPSPRLGALGVTVMPPVPAVAEFRLSVELVIVNLPVFSMPPPSLCLATLSVTVDGVRCYEGVSGRRGKRLATLVVDVSRDTGWR